MKFTLNSRILVSAASFTFGLSVGAPPAVANTPAPKGMGVLETPAGNYEFLPSFCGIYKDGEDFDIEVHGPGTTPDGEIMFFEFSSTANSFEVKIGVDEPYKSSERSISGGQFVTEPFEVEVIDRVVTASGLKLIQPNGDKIDDVANIRIDCDAARP